MQRSVPTSRRAFSPQRRRRVLPTLALFFHQSETDIMGKYVLGWLLGVPAVVLVAIYFLAH
jgi:hypothetical protein